MKWGRSHRVRPPPPFRRMAQGAEGWPAKKGGDFSMTSMIWSSHGGFGCYLCWSYLPRCLCEECLKYCFYKDIRFYQVFCLKNLLFLLKFRARLPRDSVGRAAMRMASLAPTTPQRSRCGCGWGDVIAVISRLVTLQILKFQSDKISLLWAWFIYGQSGLRYGFLIYFFILNKKQIPLLARKV